MEQGDFIHCNIIKLPNIIVAIGVLFVSNVFLYTQILFNHETKSYLINEFPRQISGWNSKDVSYDSNVLNSLDPDKIVYKIYYRNQDDPPVTLFIAYYNNLEKADLSHSPIVCFTGQGWKIEETEEIMLPIESPKDVNIMANKLYLQRIDTKMIALYWYQCVNAAFANRGIQKLYLLWEKLQGHPDGNAFVRITVAVPEGESEQKMINYLSSFVKILYPVLQRSFYNG